MATKQEKIINADLQASAFLGRYSPESVKNYIDSMSALADKIVGDLKTQTDQQAIAQLLRLQESIRLEFERIGLKAQADIVADMQATVKAQYESTVGMMIKIFPDQDISPSAFQMPSDAFLIATDPNRIIRVQTGGKQKSYIPSNEIEKITGKSSKVYQKIVGDAVLSGIGATDAIKKLESDLDIQTSKARAQMQAVTRTAIADGMDTARNEGFKLFSSVIEGWMWNSVLDNRTSLGCASLNGKVVKKRSELPRIPRHFNCRATVSPVTDFDDTEEIIQRYHIRDKYEIEREKGFKETVFKNQKTGIKEVKNPGPESKKSASDIWFDSMPDIQINKNGKEVNWKEEYLGKEKYKLYKDNNLNFSDMVSNKSLRPLRIETIRKNLDLD